MFDTVRKNYLTGRKEWVPTTEEMYDEQLCCLPPERWVGSAFLVGEPADHNSAGEAVFTCFRRDSDGNYMCMNMTIAEFEAQFRTP